MSEEVKEWRVSPSQYSTWTACKRKWYFEKVLKIASPQHPAAELGERCHTSIENYLREGTKQGDEEVLRILTYVWNQPWLLKRAVSSDNKIEEWASGEVGGVPYRGRIDLFWIEGTKAIIVDHKTTANFKYKKTLDEAKTDPQTLFYADYIFSTYPEIETIEIRYHYIQTRGLPQPPVIVEVSYTRDEIKAPLEALGVFLREMKEMRDMPLENVPTNEKSCWLYNTRCFYYAECSDTPYISNEEPIMDFGKLLNTRRAQTADAPAPATTPAPKAETALPLPPVPTPPPASGIVETITKTPQARPGDKPLFLFGCMIPGVDHVTLEELAQPYIEKWQQANKGTHYLNSDFFKAERAIAVSLAADLGNGTMPIPPVVYIASDSPIGRYFRAEMRLLRGRVHQVVSTTV